MSIADFSTIVHSLDLLTPMEQEQLSTILTAKLQAPMSRKGNASAGNDTAPIEMADADWDQLANDPTIQREMKEIETEFSATHLDGLERE